MSPDELIEIAKQQLAAVAQIRLLNSKTKALGATAQHHLDTIASAINKKIKSAQLWKESLKKQETSV